MILLPDWQFVRSLGELQILTRASYAMLVVVPILAGIWTALPPEVSSSHFLPHSWVFAFLAALAVTVGQVLYQLQGPQIVRRSTLEDYVRDARSIATNLRQKGWRLRMRSWRQTIQKCHQPA